MQVTNSKFVNELIFLGLSIIPVYEVCALVDVLVLNSVEFWTGDNPVAKNVGKTRNMMGSDGKMYAVTNLKNGYEFKDSEGNIVEFVYDKAEKVWSMQTEQGTVKLLKVKNNNTAEIYMPNGKSMDVTLDQNGMYQARMALQNGMYFALR